MADGELLPEGREVLSVATGTPPITSVLLDISEENRLLADDAFKAKKEPMRPSARMMSVKALVTSDIDRFSAEASLG